MAKEDKLEVWGVVQMALGGDKFKIKLEDNEHEIIGYISGNMRRHYIRVVPGDKVRVELSSYDLNRGRIVFRPKEKK